MSMLDTFRMSGTLYVCAIILVMLLIYAAICYLEWRLAQKEEWWKGMILPIVFLLLGRGGRFLGIILLVIYGLQRNKLQKEQNIPSEQIVSMRFDSMEYEDMTAKDMFNKSKA